MATKALQGLTCMVLCAWAGAVEKTSLSPITVRPDSGASHWVQTRSELAGSHVEMDSVGETSLTRVLSRQTSLQPRFSGGDSEGVAFQMRGQDPIQTRYYLEGIPLSDARYQSAQLGWFPAEAIESVDVFPQGTPASLGGDGLGGAVSLHLREPGKGLGNTVGLRAGSFGARRLFGQVWAPKPFALQVFMDAQASQEDFAFVDNNQTPLDPTDDKIRPRLHNGYRGFSVLPQATLLKLAGMRLDFLSFHTVRETQVPGPVGMPLQGELAQSYHLGGLRLVSQTLWGEWGIAGWGSLSYQKLDSKPGLAAAQIRESDQKSAGARVNVRQVLDSGLAWDFGAGFTFDSAALVPANGEKMSAQRLAVPFGGSAQVRFEKWVVKPGVATQLVQFIDGGTTRKGSTVSPRVGLEYWLADNHQARAAFGRYHRSPALSEIYGLPGAVSPNPDLKEESATKAEVGWDSRWRWKNAWLRELQASYTFSFSTAENLVALVPNSQSTFVAMNVGASRISSHEAGVELGLFSRGSLRLTTAVLSTENVSGVAAYRGRELPMRPGIRVGTELGWRFKRVHLHYALNASGPFFADPANTERAGAFFDHGIWGSWATSSWGTFILEGRNLADASFVGGMNWGVDTSFHTTGLAGFPAPGRRVYLTWRYEI